MATTTARRTVRRKKTGTNPVDMVVHPDVRLTDRIAQVPDYNDYTSYVSRKFDGIADLDLYDAIFAQGMHVLNEGPSGCGKTHSVYAWAAKHRLPLFSLPSNPMIGNDELFGRLVPTADGKGVTWQWSGFMDVIINGGVILLNEVNYMLDRMLPTLHTALGRERSVVVPNKAGEPPVPLHKTVMIFADGNPGYYGARPLPQAFRNRFAEPLDWDYDKSVEKALVKSDSLLSVVWSLRDRAAAGEFESAPIGTNMVLEFETITRYANVDHAIRCFSNKFVDLDERKACRQAFTAWRTNIKDEIEAAYTVTVEDEPAEEQRPRGVDEEWGVWGVDWAYEDESDVQALIDARS